MLFSARKVMPSPPLLTLTLTARLRAAAPQAAEAEGLGREKLPHAVRRSACDHIRPCLRPKLMQMRQHQELFPIKHSPHQVCEGI